MLSKGSVGSFADTNSCKYVTSQETNRFKNLIYLNKQENYKINSLILNAIGGILKTKSSIVDVQF